MLLDSYAQIAVLIPTYMPDKYVECCLDSLSKQTISKEKFCVYIALNGVAHPYREYLERLLKDVDFNYQFFTLQKPGVSEARNFLIDNSSEPYICFVDDDDILSMNYLESLLNASSEICIGISDVQTFKKNIEESSKNYIGKAFSVMEETETSLFRARKYFSSPCGKLIHREIIADVRFDSQLSKGEDGLFMAMLSPRVQSVRKSTTEPCYYVYERMGSASRKKVKFVKELVRFRYLAFSYLKLFFDSKYDKTFIASRVLATILHLKNVFPKLN